VRLLGNGGGLAALNRAVERCEAGGSAADEDLDQLLESVGPLELGSKRCKPLEVHGAVLRHAGVGGHAAIVGESAPRFTRAA